MIFGMRRKKAKKRTTKRRKKAKKTKKKAKKRKGGKKAFGGYAVSFKKVEDVPLKKVFGTGDLPPSQMTKKLWQFVKRNKLATK